eukprot:4000315-Pyramimonas_sp.AAC.1
MAYYAIYFMSWKLNSTGWTYLLCSRGYCARLGSPPTRSHSTARCFRITLRLGGNQQCFLTYLSRTTSNRRKRRTILVRIRCA